MPKLEPEWLTSELQTDAPEHEVLLAMGVKEVYAGECQMLPFRGEFTAAPLKPVEATGKKTFYYCVSVKSSMTCS
jgi:hypothetical protein